MPGDNAQSVYELSQIESIKTFKEDIKRDFGFDADFENGKYQLEKGDGAGNTFKATAKPATPDETHREQVALAK